MKTRNESLDALRGFAILTMVLSGSIAFGNVLPAWMYHAQVPPPDHQFHPEIPGITWVDLVFPFFLFSMGAAMPLALRKHMEAGRNFFFIAGLAFKRFLLLVFFALFSQHMKAWVISPSPTATDQVMSIFAFVFLFFELYQPDRKDIRTLFIALRIIAFALSAYLLWQLPFRGGKGFDLYQSDIIILVLANMALFGTLIYFLTARHPWIRIGILPFIMAVFLAAKEPGVGWAKTLFNFNHIGRWSIDWLYQFYFLKYLFIIIPGTLAGEWMMQSATAFPLRMEKNSKMMLALLAAAAIVTNLYFLFTRQLFLNLVCSLLLVVLSWQLVKKEDARQFRRRFVVAGSYCLLLGLFLEAYEGGIRKDSSTYSYYFVTSGLAFYALIIFDLFASLRGVKTLVNYFALNGKNPMVAYVAGSLLVLPLLELTHLKPFWDQMNSHAWVGLFKGILFTGLVSLITIFFVKRKWYWKT